MSDKKVEMCRRLLDEATDNMDRELARGVEAFNRLTPSEQTAEQLRKWAWLLTSK